MTVSEIGAGVTFILGGSVDTKLGESVVVGNVVE
jgi:hypothetical protein